MTHKEKRPSTSFHRRNFSSEASPLSSSIEEMAGALTIVLRNRVRTINIKAKMDQEWQRALAFAVPSAALLGLASFLAYIGTAETFAVTAGALGGIGIQAGGMHAREASEHKARLNPKNEN